MISSHFKPYHIPLFLAKYAWLSLRRMPMLVHFEVTMRCNACLLYTSQDSAIRESHRANDPRVQDAYALRCMPQVHGLSLIHI